MMTSNLPPDDSAPRTIGASASEKSRARTRRSFISDLYYLKSLLARRKFEADPLAASMIEQRLRDRRDPTNPVLIRVGLIDTNNPITRFRAVRLANGDARAEADHLWRTGRRLDHFRRFQALFELHDALVQARELPLYIRIAARFRGEFRSNAFDQPAKLFPQFRRAGRRNVVPRARCERRNGWDEVRNVRAFVLVSRERLAHDLGNVEALAAASACCFSLGACAKRLLFQPRCLAQAPLHLTSASAKQPEMRRSKSAMAPAVTSDRTEKRSVSGSVL